MVTTIFFDIGNVLVGFAHSLIWKRLAALSNLPSDEIQQRIQVSGLMELHELGKLSSLDFFHEVQTRGQLKPSVSFEDFSVIWADIFWENRLVVQLAKTLQLRYSIFLLSNTGEIHWNWLVEQFPIFREVDGQILSYQVGYMKPAKEIYQEALRRSGSVAEQCVYIDDIAAYVKASRELGIQGILYQSPEQLKNSLRRLNIELNG